MHRKAVRQFLARVGEGWDYELTNGDHIRLTHKESGRVVHTASTPSDSRGEKNALARCRRIEREESQRKREETR